MYKTVQYFDFSVYKLQKQYSKTRYVVYTVYGQGVGWITGTKLESFKLHKDCTSSFPYKYFRHPLHSLACMGLCILTLTCLNLILSDIYHLSRAQHNIYFVLLSILPQSHGFHLPHLFPRQLMILYFPHNPFTENLTCLAAAEHYDLLRVLSVEKLVSLPLLQ